MPYPYRHFPAPITKSGQSERDRLFNEWKRLETENVRALSRSELEQHALYYILEKAKLMDEQELRERIAQLKS